MKNNLLSLAIAGTVLFSTSALALPQIGFDPTGNSGVSGWLYADTWNYATDRGVDVKQTGTGGINSFTPGDVHNFHTQMAINSFQDNNPGGIGTYTPTGMNGFPSGFELTKEIVLTDTVNTFTPNAAGGGTVTFTSGENTSSVMSIYLDYYGAGDASKSSGSTGATNVSCYGGPNNCGSASDQTGAFGTAIGPIITAHMLSNTSSFTAATPGVGTGSFQIVWKIDAYNPAYINLSSLGGLIFADTMDGTLTQLATQFPGHMWDGTLASGNKLFDITGRQVFQAENIPEPSSLALIGFGLIFLGFAMKKNKLYTE